MAYDEKLCAEKHRGVSASLNRLWGFFVCMSLGIGAWLGYVTVEAARANEIAAALKVRHDAVDQKLDLIIK